LGFLPIHLIHKNFPATVPFPLALPYSSPKRSHLLLLASTFLPILLHCAESGISKRTLTFEPVTNSICHYYVLLFPAQPLGCLPKPPRRCSFFLLPRFPFSFRPSYPLPTLPPYSPLIKSSSLLPFLRLFALAEINIPDFLPASPHVSPCFRILH